MSSKSKLGTAGICFLIVVAAAAVAWFVATLSRPLIGDDLVYAVGWNTNYGRLTDLPLSMARHWIGVNSRMADMLTPLWLSELPRWVLSLITALSVGLMLYASARLAYRGSNRAAAGVVAFFATAVLLVALPWWDSAMLFVVQTGYVWTSAWVLGILLLLLRHPLRSRGWLILVPFALLAAWMHEAMGFPVACGLVAYAFVNRRQLSRYSLPARLTALALIIGGLLTLTSPASWSRLSHPGSLPDDPVWLLLLKSDFLVLLLVAAILYCLWCKPLKIGGVAHSDALIFCIAALVSMLFSAVSGVVGRSGWFAQILALIPLARLLSPSDDFRSGRMLRAVIVCLTAALCLHLALFARLQLLFNAETAEVLSLYEKSHDGTVYYDAHYSADAPWWLCGNKAMSAPDADDLWLITTVDREIGHGGKHLVILPSALKSRDLSTLKAPEKVGDDCLLVPNRPSRTRLVTTAEGSAEMCQIQGRPYVVQPVSAGAGKVFFLTPVRLNPGQRLPELTDGSPRQ